MSQNLQNLPNFQKIQLANLVDFARCCKTHIYLQRSAPIQPKNERKFTEHLPKKLTTTPRVQYPWSLASRRRAAGAGAAVRRRELGGSSAASWGAGAFAWGRFGLRVRVSNIGKISKILRSTPFKILQIFGGLVLGCIKTKFCKKICV